MDANWKNSVISFDGIEVSSVDYINLSDTRRSWLNSICYDLTVSGFCQDPSESLHKDTLRHLWSSDNLWIIEDSFQDKIVGYLMFSIYEHAVGKIAYIGGIMIDPAYQNRGIFSSLITIIRNIFSPTYICARTQNPNVYRAIESACKVTYPDLNESSIVPTLIESIAIFVTRKTEMLVTDSKIDHNLIFRGVYNGEMLYGFKPVNKDFDFYVKFNRYINVTTGDAVFVVGTF